MITATTMTTSNNYEDDDNGNDDDNDFGDILQAQASHSSTMLPFNSGIACKDDKRALLLDVVVWTSVHLSSNCLGQDIKRPYNHL